MPSDEQVHYLPRDLDQVSIHPDRVEWIRPPPIASAKQWGKWEMRTDNGEVAMVRTEDDEVVMVRSWRNHERLALWYDREFRPGCLLQVFSCISHWYCLQPAVCLPSRVRKLIGHMAGLPRSYPNATDAVRYLSARPSRSPRLALYASRDACKPPRLPSFILSRIPGTPPAIRESFREFENSTYADTDYFYSSHSPATL
ncbi:hypothetical protein C8J57DRAFT_1252408 [Mycena rebaudengoi]|nr:hypothetical protein C8J57DRAFT_1252408 [Mycena rebaudengoi]